MFSPSRCLATAKEILFVEMGPGAMIDVPGLMKTASANQKFKWKFAMADTDNKVI
jgi:hypothetical protein